MSWAPGAPSTGSPKPPASISSIDPPVNGPHSPGEAHRAPPRGPRAAAAVARIRCPSAGEFSSSRQAWRNRRSSPSGPRPARARPVERVARDRMPDRIEVDADLVRPAGDEVQLQQRPAVEPLLDAVARDRRPAVGDDAPSVSAASGSRPIGASIRPTAAATLPWTRARYVFLIRRALSWAISEAWAPSCLATMSSPLVSRSRRCTMPGRDDPGDPPVVRSARPSQERVDERVGRVAGRGMDDQPRWLVDDEQVVVLVDHGHRDVRRRFEVQRASAAARRDAARPRPRRSRSPGAARRPRSADRRR